LFRPICSAQVLPNTHDPLRQLWQNNKHGFKSGTFGYNLVGKKPGLFGPVVLLGGYLNETCNSVGTALFLWQNFTGHQITEVAWIQCLSCETKLRLIDCANVASEQCAKEILYSLLLFLMNIMCVIRRTYLHSASWNNGCPKGVKRPRPKRLGQVYEILDLQMYSSDSAVKTWREGGDTIKASVFWIRLGEI